MNKKFKTYAICWAVLLAAFNVIAFVTPSNMEGMNKFGGAFWAGYVFITLAFVGQLVCAYIALNTESKMKLFYNISIINTSYVGLMLTIIVGGICMAVPDFPNWAGIVVCLLILVVNILAVIKAKTASDIVEKIDNKVKAKTFFIKSLTVDADSLLSRANTAEEKAACQKVYEALRYSDTMSNEALAGVESQITLKFNELSNAVISGDGNAERIAGELVVLIGDRNKKCKLLK